MVIVSLDMSNVAPATRIRFSNRLRSLGWAKPHRTKTTWQWSKQNPITAIVDFMGLVEELKLKKHITHLVVHMIRD